MKQRRTPLLAVMLSLTMLLAACVPQAVSDQLATPEGQALERAAQETYHRMELGRIRLGVYTTNVLVDVDLPRGARVTVEAFDDHDYRLRLDSDVFTQVRWFITPRGVQRQVQR